MSLILDKLVAAGVPQSAIDSLQAKYGDGLIDEVQKNGLKAVAEKAGIDLSNINLPDVDFSALMGMGADMLGKTDTDGDGKTGLAEVKDTLGDMAEKAGLGDAVDTVKGVFAEARGTDTDGDGKTGVMEAVGQAKGALEDVKDTVMNSAVGEKVADLAGNAKDAMMKTEVGAKVADAAGSVTTQAGGLFSKIKSFFGA